MPDFYSAVVTQHTNPVGTFHVLKFQLPNQSKFDFKPGQFIAIRIDDHLVKDYSMSSLPNDNEFEIIVNIGIGHEGSYFIDQLRVGDYIKFKGPTGNFFYRPDDGAGELIFFTNGAGIGPVKAILEQLTWQQADPHPLKLYYGLVPGAELFLQDFFSEMSDKYPNFTFTSAKTSKNLHQLQSDYPSSGRLAAYLCGGGQMVHRVTQILTAQGTPPNRIYHEVHFAIE
jgi:NAD(P)H-flavin reductase